jgi:hypothetical protein
MKYDRKDVGCLTHTNKSCLILSLHVTYKRRKILKSQQDDILYHISLLHTHLPFQINTVIATIMFISGGDKYPKTKHQKSTRTKLLEILYCIIMMS